jgi:ferric-dicitrate binding protein FerR (iron transport regulator)
MSDASSRLGSYDPSNDIRPLSVRMTEGTRAQLDIIAQLNDRSVTEEVREALEFWIERSKSDPKVLERADAVKAEIEREAATKRDAIAAIFDKPQKEKPAAASTPKVTTVTLPSAPGSPAKPKA